MKVLFDYCLEQRDVVDFELVLNYSLEYPGENLKGHSGLMSDLLKRFQDNEWIFDCLPDDILDSEPRSINFIFDKNELHVLALCVDHYLSLDDFVSLRLKNRLLTVLLWSFFD